MIYLIVLVLLGRALRYRIYIQHHSYAYLSADFLPMRLLARASANSTHLCSCAKMSADLSARYPVLRVVRTLPLAYAVRQPELPSADRGGPGPEKTTLRIGLFGNITKEKGVAIAVETLEVALDRGFDVSLALGGPVVGREAKELVAAAQQRHGCRITSTGALDSEQRDRFLASLDLLLFPSTYTHESFGLAFWEGLSVGTPAVAYTAGCLTQSLAGSSAYVIETSESFVTAAVKAVAEMHGDRGKHEKRRNDAKTHTQSMIAEAQAELKRFASEVWFDGGA